MLLDVIYLLNVKIANTGYINNVLCLADRLEREGKIYPAIYNNNNEYRQIDLDSKGSLSYWRKNGDVNISEEENTTSACGIQYKTTVPLKLIVFIKKDSSQNNSAFSDSLAQNLIGILTTNNSSLRDVLKAKKATVTATGYSTDWRKVAKDEYDKIDFETRYTHAYFSIDFNLIVTTNQQCYTDICDQGVIDPLTKYNFCDEFTFDRLTDLQKECLTLRLCENMTLQEIPLVSGAIDGVNTVFVWSQIPLILELNGQTLRDGGVGYTLVGMTTTLTSPPFAGDYLWAYGNY